MSIIPYATAELWSRRVFSLSFALNFFLPTGMHCHVSLGFWTLGLDVVFVDVVIGHGRRHMKVRLYWRDHQVWPFAGMVGAADKSVVIWIGRIDIVLTRP